MNTQAISIHPDSNGFRQDTQGQKVSDSLKATQKTKNVFESCLQAFKNMFGFKTKSLTEKEACKAENTIKVKGQKIEKKKESIISKVYKFTPYISIPIMAYNYPVAALIGCSTYAFSKLSYFLSKKLILKGLTTQDIKKCEHLKRMNELSLNSKSVIFPIVEESIFRGVIQNGLSYILGNNMGLLSSSLLFGVAHLVNANNDKASFHLQTAQGINATIIGVAIGIINNTYGLLGSITTHMVHNFLFSQRFS